MIRDKEKRSLASQIAFTMRLIVVVYALGLLASGLWAGVTLSTSLLLVAQSLAIFGLVSPVPRRALFARRAIGTLAALCFLLTIILRAEHEAIPPRQGELLSVGGTHHLTFGDIIPERDILATATRFLPLVGGLSLSEATDLLPAISTLYRSMNTERGTYTSPLLLSVLGAPLLFDSKVLSFEAPNSERSQRALVFLHGTGGNIGLLCWIISKAGEVINANTYCPSLGPLGMWGSDRGREILRDLITTLNARGKTEIYLVGVSAGAVGAAQLASEFALHLRGIALVSGSHPAIRETNLPVLFLYGTRDERFPPKLLRWIANQSAQRNPNTTLAELEGDHLLVIKQFDSLLSELSRWLSKVASELER